MTGSPTTSRQTQPGDEAKAFLTIDQARTRQLARMSVSLFSAAASQPKTILLATPMLVPPRSEPIKAEAVVRPRLMRPCCKLKQVILRWEGDGCIFFERSAFVFVTFPESASCRRRPTKTITRQLASAMDGLDGAK